jgi:putative transposase
VQVHQAFRFELGPNDHARADLRSYAGAARFVYNWGLGLVKGTLDARSTCQQLALRNGATMDEAQAWAAEVVGQVPWSFYGLRKRWNAEKNVVAPWWRECSKQVFAYGLANLANGFKAFFSSRKGERKGPKVEFPTFKGRGARRSFRFDTAYVVDGRHVRLPKIGTVRTKSLTEALLSKVQAGAGRVLSATVSGTAGRWYVSFGCEAEREQGTPALPDEVVGVDLGVKSLAVLSTGEVVPNPKPLSRYARRMARLQRTCSRRKGPGKGRPPSKRWLQTKRAVAKVHAKVANVRSDGLHKLTTRLAKTYGTVVVEDLAVKGMTAKPKPKPDGAGGYERNGGRPKAGLNRAVLDVSPGELRRQLAYKCQWYGSTLHAAERWYPSSKTCSGCGAVKAKLSLSERIFTCERCGLVIDRDLNAALNLASLVEATGAASGAGTGQGDLENAQGEAWHGSGRVASVNCEDGAGPHGPGKTATVSSQDEAA